jgi:glycerophosphoryl diester phosphodiesterase
MKYLFLGAILAALTIGGNPASAEDYNIDFGGSAYSTNSSALPVPAINPVDVSTGGAVNSPSGRIGGKFLIIGHTGSPKKEPDNTLEGFAQALKDGANGLETDVCITKDNVLVLWHDWSPDGSVAFARKAGLQGFKYRPFFDYGAKPVNQLTLEELRKGYGYLIVGPSNPDSQKSHHQIPTFEEFAAWAAVQSGIDIIYLDIKLLNDADHYTEFFVSEIWRITEKYGISDKVVFFTPHKDLAILASQFAKKSGIGLKIGLDREMPASLTMSPVGDDAGKAIINVPDFAPVRDASDLDLDYASVGRPSLVTVIGGWKTYSRIITHNVMLKNSLDLKPLILSWTINDKKEMLWLYKAGVSGILTDVPEKALQMLKEQGLSQ